MFQSIRLSCVFLLLIATVGNARWSAFAHVTPETREDFDLPVCVVSTKTGRENVTIQVQTYEPSGFSKVAWLITTTEHLDSTDQEFRKYIWNDTESDSPIISIELLERQSEIEGISVTLPQSEMRRAYIYVDFPRPVNDGGYYYSIDLATFADHRDKGC